MINWVRPHYKPALQLAEGGPESRGGETPEHLTGGFLIVIIGIIIMIKRVLLCK